MEWKDISFKQYLEITEIQQRNDTNYNKLLDMTAVINDVDVETITIQNFKQYAENIKFISEDIPVVEIKDEYVNYTLQKDLSNMSMKQYIDFNNYAKANDYVGVLSVFLIPKDKEYNKDYNIDEVREYILTMPCTDVLSIYAFFLMQSQVYMERFHDYLLQKQMKILKERKQRRRTQMKRMEIYQLYTRYVRILIYHTYRYLRCLTWRCYISLIGWCKGMNKRLSKWNK